MKLKMILALSLIFSQEIFAAAPVNDSATMIVLSETLYSKPPTYDRFYKLQYESSGISAKIEELKYKLMRMRDENGSPLDPNKISEQTCYIDTQHLVNGEFVPGHHTEVFVFYHSKSGKDFKSAIFCGQKSYGGGTMLKSSDAFGG